MHAANSTAALHPSPLPQGEREGVARRPWLALFAALLLALPAAAQTVTRPIDLAGAKEVALLRFHTGGHADAAGKGIAVVDKHGKGVPYRLVAHHPAGETVVAIDPRNAAAPLSLQYSRKPLAASHQTDDIWPSLLLQTFPLERDRFRDAADLAATLTPQAAAGTMQVGHVYQASNPFGPQARFATLVQGLLKIDRAGEVPLFSVNDDAAFVEIDGNVVIAQPARTVASDPQKLAQQAVAVPLAPGAHRVRYLHVQNGGEQSLAILGVMQGERAVPAPEAMFVKHAWAKLGPAASGASDRGAAVGFDAQRLDEMSYDGRVYTRHRFVPIAPAPPGSRYRWDFGDGTSWSAGDAADAGVASEREAASGGGSMVDHVFVAPEAQLERQAWTVTLELVDDKGKALGRAATAFRPVNLGDGRSVNDPKALAAYAAAVGQASYDRADAELIAALFPLVDAAEKPALVAPLAEAFVKRFGNRGGDVGWKLKKALATHLSQSDPERAEKLFGELAASAPDSWQATAAAAERLDLLIFRLGRAQGLEQRIAQLQLNKSPRERALLKARLGDLHRAAGRFDRAAEAYREAQKDAAREMDPRQAAVVERGYRETAVSHLEQGRLPALRDTLLQWEADFPTAKLGGELPLVTGRYFQAIGDDARAGQEFETLLKLNPLHASRPEIVYRLAQSRLRLGEADEAAKLFDEVARDYPNSPFGKQAADGGRGAEASGPGEVGGPLKQVGRFNPIAAEEGKK